MGKRKRGRIGAREKRHRNGKQRKDRQTFTHAERKGGNWAGVTRKLGGAFVDLLTIKTTMRNGDSWREKLVRGNNHRGEKHGWCARATASATAGARAKAEAGTRAAVPARDRGRVRARGWAGGRANGVASSLRTSTFEKICAEACSSMI